LGACANADAEASVTAMTALARSFCIFHSPAVTWLFGHDVENASSHMNRLGMERLPAVQLGSRGRHRQAGAASLHSP
jgi:hypothetical protein